MATISEILSYIEPFKQRRRWKIRADDYSTLVYEDGLPPPLEADIRARSAECDAILAVRNAEVAAESKFKGLSHDVTVKSIEALARALNAVIVALPTAVRSNIVQAHLEPFNELKTKLQSIRDQG